MKKLLLIPIFVAIIVTVVAANGLPNISFDGVTGTSTKLPMVGATVIDSTTVPLSIAKSNNDFAIDFYRQISDNDENIFFSPTSMYTAFSVLYEGAQGNTAHEMQQVFGFEADSFTRHNNTAHMISAINQDDPYATLDLANALWLADWFKPYDSYLNVSRGTYLASTEQLDFIKDKENSAKTINDWASDNTNGKIPEVITKDDLDNLTAMIISNAIYFKGTWLTQFSVDDTKKSDFWNGTQAVSTDFMNNLGGFNYTQSNGAKVLKMPYEGDRLSMLVILPDDKDGLVQLESLISSDQIRQWNDDLRSQEVDISIPKFEMRTHYDLNSPMINLGMVDVFDKKDANLLGIAEIPPDANLYVSKAVQDAYVKVNEEGTEAAAVTTIIVMMNESVPPPPTQFIADHPFLFIIQDDQSGMILFMGRITTPE